MTQAIWYNVLWDRGLCAALAGHNKSPTKMRSRHKIQNIDMKAVIIVGWSIFQYFSIFLSGCKQPNLSTFRTVSRRSLSFSGCKDTQKSGYANFIFSRIRKSGLKTIFKFRHIIKKCYLRTLKLSINQLNRYETNI